MYEGSTVDEKFALDAANRLISAGGAGECNAIFYELLNHKQLSHTVHHLNRLLRDEKHFAVAAKALRCLGLKPE